MQRPYPIRTRIVPALRTQYETTPKFLDSFVRRNELFGDLPPILLSRQTAGRPEASRESSDPEPAAEEEPAHLVGTVTWSARIEDERGVQTPATALGNANLVFSIQLSRPLAKEVGCSVYLFGYRGDTPFADMPKLHIGIGELTHSVSDGGQKVAGKDIQVRRLGRDILIHVPLSMLRQPQDVLAAAQLHVGPIPLEWTAWRILALDTTAR